MTFAPRSWPLAALPLTALAGCGDAAPGPAAWRVAMDTLPTGVPRVTNTPPAEGVEPTWVIEEELRVGTAMGEGAGSFGQLKGLAVLSDGRIAVLDAQAQEVRVFGPDGAHQATFGRKGAGPGEFEGAWGLMRGADDRLWVPDHRNNRMSVIHPDSGFETSWQMPVLMYGFVWTGAMLEGGRILEPSITLAPVRRPMLRIYGPDMTLVDSIVQPEPPPVDQKDPPGAFYWEAPGGLPRGYMSVPFYPASKRAWDPAGSVWSSLAGDPAYGITRATLRGDTTLVIDTKRPAIPVPDAERDSAIDRVRESLKERGAAANQDWSKVPRVRPAIEHLFVAENGRLWVRTASPDTMVHFDVYGNDGRYAGTAVATLSPWQYVDPVVRGSRIWFITADDMGVQYVVRGRIRDAIEPVTGE